MSFSRVQFQETMSFSQLVSALNENFATLESLNRTNIIRDEKGVNRIIIGKLPDGTYGLVISKPGVDVIKLVQS